MPNTCNSPIIYDFHLHIVKINKETNIAIKYRVPQLYSIHTSTAYMSSKFHFLNQVDNKMCHNGKKTRAETFSWWHNIRTTLSYTLSNFSTFSSFLYNCFKNTGNSYTKFIRLSSLTACNAIGSKYCIRIWQSWLYKLTTCALPIWHIKRCCLHIHMAPLSASRLLAMRFSHQHKDCKRQEVDVICHFIKNWVEIGSYVHCFKILSCFQVILDISFQI